MIKLANKLIKALTGKFNAGAFPPVQDPKADATALYTTATGMKIGYEVLTRRRGDVGDSALLVKEIDYLLELLVAELDARYNIDTAVEQSDSNFAALIKEFEALIDNINAHIGNEGIHGGDETTIIEGGCCIDDATVSTETSWSSQKTKNELPHALFSTRHTDIKPGGSPQKNQALIVDTDNSKQFILAYPTIWRGVFAIESTPYYKGDQVEQEGWLMTCNAVDGTTENAAPTIIGPEEFIFADTPAWTATVATGLVKMSMQVVMDPNLCQQFRVWPAAVGVGINNFYEVIIRRGGAGAIPVSRSYFNPVLLAGQWNVLQFADTPLVDGTIVDIDFYTLNTASETGLGPYDYIYAGTNQVPLSGEWSVSSNRRILRISKTDADGIDRSAEVGGGVSGSSILFQVELILSNYQEYLALSTGTDQGTYYEYSVTRIDTSGTINAGDRCLASGVIPVPDATDFVKFPGYFPTGDPSWGTCTTSLTIDGVVTSEPVTTGYGIDIGAAPGVISEFWDYNNYSEVTPAV